MLCGRMLVSLVFRCSHWCFKIWRAAAFNLMCIYIYIYYAHILIVSMYMYTYIHVQSLLFESLSILFFCHESAPRARTWTKIGGNCSYVQASRSMFNSPGPPKHQESNFQRSTCRKENTMTTESSQMLTRRRFRCAESAESESEVKNLGILHPDVKII